MVIAAVSVGLGVWHGFVRTVFSLASWAIAVLGTPPLAPWAATPFFSGPPGPGWYALVFVVLLVGTRLAGSLVAALLRKAGLGLADRSLGAVLGAARALLVVGALALAAQALGMTGSSAWERSLSRPLLDGIVRWAEPWLPERDAGTRRT